MTRILGIDPGLAATGWGIIEARGNTLRYLAHDTIHTASDTDTGNRLNIIFEALEEVLQTYRPEKAAIERVYFAKNRTSAIPVAQAMGVLLLVLSRRQIKVFEYPPQEIKKAITGQGRAEKMQVRELVRVVLGMPSIPDTDHAADALAAAVCCQALTAFRTAAGGL